MIPNFFTVDEPVNGGLGVYRGGQPVTKEDWDKLKSLSVNRIVKLNTDAEGIDNIWPGVELIWTPIDFMQQFVTGPEVETLIQAVRLIAPGTFVHCGSVKRSIEAEQTGDQEGKGGNDRTGWVIAVYRVLIQGWTKARARAEMIERGFHIVEFGLDREWARLPENIS